MNTTKEKDTKQPCDAACWCARATLIALAIGAIVYLATLPFVHNTNCGKMVIEVEVTQFAMNVPDMKINGDSIRYVSLPDKLRQQLETLCDQARSQKK